MKIPNNEEFVWFQSLQQTTIILYVRQQRKQGQHKWLLSPSQAEAHGWAREEPEIMWQECKSSWHRVFKLLKLASCLNNENV